MVQALIESGMKDDFKTVFSKANDFVDLTQIRVDHPDHDRYYRDITKGGWPFSTRDIGWVVADCTPRTCTHTRTHSRTHSRTHARKSRTHARKHACMHSFIASFVRLFIR